MILRSVNPFILGIVLTCYSYYIPVEAEETIPSDNAITAETSATTCKAIDSETAGSCQQGTATNEQEERDSSKSQHFTECGVWLALSTLPGTGIGMFAGRNFSKDEQYLNATGDHLLPIVDVLAHQGVVGDLFFLWDDYTWKADAMYMHHLGIEEVNVASAGFGAAANSFMDFVNADEGYPTYSIPHGLHRRSDPGVGAFTYYHSRDTIATSFVPQGQELFVSYGNKWFLGRKDKLGAIPIRGDHEKADLVYRKFRTKFVDQTKVMSSPSGRRKTITGRIKKPPPPPDDPSPANPELADVASEIWDTFVLNSAWEDSPTMAALPPKEDYDAMYEKTLLELKKSRMNRSPEWLEEHGVCADNMYFGESTVRQAGHGAFASRRLRGGTRVLPIPLIHIPDRKVLNMYDFKGESSKERVINLDHSRPRQPQLLLNYCLGHRDSTMLLSPYGPIFNLVNHNQSLANVRLQWASPERSQHNPEMLHKNVSEFESYRSAQLAMELVALRDIAPGEEIFLDYGDEWEAAWQNHVQEWKPVFEADFYVSAYEMNLQSPDHIVRTEFEQMLDPYPPNLMLRLHKYFLNDKRRKHWLRLHPAKALSYTEIGTQFHYDGSIDCEILRWKRGAHDRILYTVVVPKDELRKKWLLIEEVPQEAIFFQDRPYTTDMFLENAFRHDIRIPDDMFPEAWKNLKSD